MNKILQLKENIGIYCWMLLLIFAPFFNGYNDKMPLIFVGIIFFLYFLCCYKEELCWDIVTLSLGASFLWTLLGLFYGSNDYEIIFGAVTWLLLGIFYLLVRSFFREHLEKKSMVFSMFLYLVGIILAIYNFYVYFCYCITLPDYRFQVGIEYSNTLALFFCIGVFAGAYLIKSISLRWKKTTLFAGQSLLLAALLFTYSRMMWVIGGFFFLVFFLFLYRKTMTKKVVVGITLGVMGLIALVIILDTIFSFGFIERLTSIRLSATELNERFAYYHDSLRILKDNPLWGLGSGGWYSTLFQYQSGVYITRYPHSIFAQSAVDGGIVLLIFVGIILLYPLIKSFKIALKSDIGGMCYLMNLMMLCHGMLDFDFQFPAVFMVFLANQGILLALCKDNGRELKRMPRKILNAFLIIMLPFLCYFAVVESYFTIGNENFEKGNYQNAAKYLSYGAELEVYHSKMDYTYAKTLAALNPVKNADNIEEAVGKAIKADAGNPKYYRFLGDHYSSISMEEKSVEAYDQLIDLQPILLKNYLSYEDNLISLKIKAREAGDKETIASCNKALAEIPKRIKEAKEIYSFWTFRLNHLPELDRYEAVDKG